MEAREMKILLKKALRKISRPNRSRKLSSVGLKKTFGGQAHPYVVNFMKLLVQKEHFDSFRLCRQWFHQRYNEDFQILEAYVTSAVALTDDEREALKKRLCAISGKNIDLIASVDPALIGGVRVEMDGRRYDNTIQDRLGRLRRSLTQGL